jgi:predicted PurR-regulated permease PerM
MGVLFIVVLITLTIWVLRPFLGATIWATMIVVATWPLMRHMQQWLWGRRGLAAAAMVLAQLLVLLVPLSLVIGAITANAGGLFEWASKPGSFVLPPPPPWLAAVPVVGAAAMESWQRLAAGHLANVAASAAPYAAAALVWVAGVMRGMMSLMLQFLLTMAIAGVMYMKGEHAAAAVRRFGRRLGGQPGERVTLLAAQAIRSVALGVIVTAIVQAALAGVGLAVAGVPYSALLGALTFILCIAQLGPFLVMAPSVGWLVWQGQGSAATLLLVWAVVVGVLDNVLRPLLISKSGNLPMLLMFAGVIGGLLAFGLIGIFVGPVVLAITYTLLAAWTNAESAEDRVQQPT